VNDFEMVQMGLPGWRAALDRIEAEGEKRLADVRKMDDLRMAEIRELKAEVERLRARNSHYNEAVEWLKAKNARECAAYDVARRDREWLRALVDRQLIPAQREVERLRAENEHLRARLGDPFEIDRLKKEVERLRAANQEFASEHARMNADHRAEVERLQDQVEGLLSVEFENRKEIEGLQERLAGALALYEGATKRAEKAETEVERLRAGLAMQKTAAMKGIELREAEVERLQRSADLWQEDCRKATLEIERLRKFVEEQTELGRQ